MAEPTADPRTDATHEEPQPLSAGRMLAYAAASLGTGAFYIFNNAALPLFLRPLTGSDVLIGLLSSTRSFEGAVVQPIVGAWSDRTRTPWGRRRPFMLVAVPLAALLLALTPLAPSLLWVVVAIVLFSLFFNMAVDPYTALLADIAPQHQRGTLSGLATLVQFIPGQVGVALLVAQLADQGQFQMGFVVVAALLLVGFAITIVGVREPPRPAPREKFALRQYLASLLAHRQAMKFFLGLFLFFFGMNAVLPFLTLYATREIGVTEAEALRLFIVPVVVTGVLAYPMGRLGDRGLLRLGIGRFGLTLRVGPAPSYKRLIAFGIGCLAVAAVLGTVATDLGQLVALLLLAGVGNGALTALWWPQLTALIPSDQAGVFYGLSGTVQSIAFPISVVLAGVLIEVFATYRVVFAVLAIMCALSFLVFLWVKVPAVRSVTKVAP